MLVTSKELFKKAQEGKFAIPAPNFIDLESLRWHVETAERHNLPLILALAEAHIGENITLEDAALVGKKYAEEAKVPVVLHLDHGTTPEVIKKAIDLGVSKINVNTECQLSFAAATRKYVEEGKDQQGKGYDPRKLLAPGFEAIKATVKEKMELFGSVGKA